MNCDTTPGKGLIPTTGNYRCDCGWRGLDFAAGDKITHGKAIEVADQHEASCLATQEDGEREPITLTQLDGCARCGQRHLELTFEVFDQPFGDFTHWAPCPTNSQPILLSIKRRRTSCWGTHGEEASPDVWLSPTPEVAEPQVHRGCVWHDRWLALTKSIGMLILADQESMSEADAVLGEMAEIERKIPHGTPAAEHAITPASEEVSATPGESGPLFGTCTTCGEQSVEWVTRCTNCTGG